MANLAVAVHSALERRRVLGDAGRAAARVLARGDGWSVADVVCTSGPQDRPFEERHSHYSIAIVLAGTFQYRSDAGRALLTPGSLMLGNPGQCFECGHEHAEGDRCVSFWYDAEYFERLAADTGDFRRSGLAGPSIPPVRSLAPLVASAAAKVVGPTAGAWEELAIEVAARALSLDGRGSPPLPGPATGEARVTQTIRSIDRHPEAALPLGRMARGAGLSPYHFLRIFRGLTGVTPHQYVLRTRLRQAALRLARPQSSILDIALECGFGDLSNFNRAFRAEFGCTPRAYRQRVGQGMSTFS